MSSVTRKSLFHCPLEPYAQRYTELLHNWERRAFGKRFDLTEITPPEKDSWVAMNIGTGEVLDSVARPVWAMKQIVEVLKRAPALGRIWFSDFYHPGLDSIAYSRSQFRAYSFLWSQTFDQYDFTRRHFVNWMRPWEVMAFEVYEKVFVASTMLKELITSALPHVEEKVMIVGLPFDYLAVQKQLGTLPVNREYDVVYSSRFDEEKRPELFLRLVEELPELNCAICTGHPTLKGTDSKAVRHAKKLQEKGNLTIFENCKKPDYYRVLAESKVQVNTSLQDWVSFTLLEALTFGCLPLYPAWRSFPETLMYREEFLYNPDFFESLAHKLTVLLDSKGPKDFEDFRMTILEYHSGTLARIATVIDEL
jgi:glycosyltransferase involved in cell wall biosynthesis